MAQAEALMAMCDHQLAVLACGRRGGKSLLASIWAMYYLTMRDLRKYQRKGETRYVLLVAASVPLTRARRRPPTGHPVNRDLYPLAPATSLFWKDRIAIPVSITV